ncbi:MAG: MFS transporter [Chloroflexota bacterium]|nr:MFS transporter [Chloroflexota bacterium]
MFLSAIVLALIVGLFAGGGLPRLADLRLRAYWLLGLALALRILAALLDSRLAPGIPVGWAYIGAYLLILGWLWLNWRVPGLQVAAVGIGLNTLAVLLNAGQMPVWAAAFRAAGFTPAAIQNDPFHYLLTAKTVGEFVGSGGLLGDVMPIPLPLIRDVVSIGDLLLALGIFWAIVYSMTRPEAPVWRTRLLGANQAAPAGATEFEAGVAYAAAFAGPGTLVPAGPMPSTAIAAPARAIRGQSPYLRLVRNRNFSLLWAGQLVSFFGDRVHQVALGVLVAQRGSPLEVGFTFAATAVPNVVLGPLAGALADRWDRRRTMIGCDLVRAGLVLLVPLAIGVSIGLVYLLAFAVATVSLLFRPAKNAVMPLIVGGDDLVTANSASTVSETLADLIGYPVAGIIVAVLGPLVAAAFVLDSATYLVSALLLVSMSTPIAEILAAPLRLQALLEEMREGWRFLRGQPELFANTVVSSVAQVAVGTEIVCSLLYAKSVLDPSRIGYPENYSLLMAAIGLGSVIGGVAIGGMAARFRKGLLSIAGFTGIGLTLVAAGLVTDPYLAIAIFFLTGATNMLFIIPNMTLFQERTPQRLMGRVVSTRQAIVFAAMALAMGLSGWLASIVGPAAVLIIGGTICALTGLAGLLVPAMRNAR